MKILIIIIIISILLSGCISDRPDTDVPVKVIKYNGTINELVYVNPPFVIFDDINNYDVVFDNETFTYKTSKNLELNATAMVKQSDLKRKV